VSCVGWAGHKLRQSYARMLGEVRGEMEVETRMARSGCFGLDAVVAFSGSLQH